jgi:ABC-type transporter lipoprotein component MlaA
MFKCKLFLNFILVFALSFNSNNVSLAIDDVKLVSKYPDYAYEFVGQDKWENFNRKIFVFNLKANKYILRPVNIAWASVMPQYGMDRIQSFYTNMNYPVRLAGCLLQKDF